MIKLFFKVAYLGEEFRSNEHNGLQQGNVIAPLGY